MNVYGNLPNAGHGKRGADMNEKEFTEIYRTHHARISAWVRSKVPDWSTTEDIVSRSFMAAWEHRAECREDFKAWLYQIAHNEISHHYHRHHADENIDDHFDLVDPHDFYQALSRDEDVAKASKAASRLKDKYQQALFLHVRGYSLQEAASIVGVPVGTMGRRIFQAKEKLRGMLCRI